MAKLTAQEKTQAVKKYLEGTEGQKTIAESMGVTKGVLQNWIKRYQHHGEAAFKKNYTTYSVEYKLKVLNYLSEHGMSICEAAAIFNLPTHSLLLSWKNEFETKGVDALIPKKKGSPSMKDKKEKTLTEGSVETLQAKVERLRMENAYLKKLNALVQNKEKLRSKTKRK